MTTLLVCGVTCSSAAENAGSFNREPSPRPARRARFMAFCVELTNSLSSDVATKALNPSGNVYSRASTPEMDTVRPEVVGAPAARLAIPRI